MRRQADLSIEKNAEQLRGYVARLQHIEVQQAIFSKRKSTVYKELRVLGFDKGTVRLLVQKLKPGYHDRSTDGALMERYMEIVNPVK